MNEPICSACNDTGFIPFTRTIRNTRNMPWAAACLCVKGLKLSSTRAHDPKSVDPKRPPPPPVVVQPIDRELYHERMDQAAHPNHPNSTPERRRAALRYIVASFGHDAKPIGMVEAILAGERDDVVRTLRPMVEREKPIADHDNPDVDA